MQAIEGKREREGETGNRLLPNICMWMFVYKYIAYFERHNHVDVPLEFQEDDDDKNKYK